MVSSSRWLSSVSRRSISSRTTSSRSPCLRCRFSISDCRLASSRAAETCPASSRARSLSILVRNLVHVAFRPALLPAQVAELGLGRHQGVLELAGPGLQAAELGDFGQAVPAVVETAKLGVQVGEFEQAELDLR